MDSPLLALVIVVLLLLVALLAVLIYRQSQQTPHLLMVMVRERDETIQSLLNQLRTQNLPDLLTLNAATNLSTSDSEGYVSQSDGAEFMRFPVGVGDELTQEDLAAFGAPFVIAAEDN